MHKATPVKNHNAAMSTLLTLPCSGNVPLTVLYIENQVHVGWHLDLMHKCMCIHECTNMCIFVPERQKMTDNGREEKSVSSGLINS